MFLNILNGVIVVASLLGLVILHEFGHFITAKRFGVKVDEFGIGYPPKLFGKKIGETVYSVNLIPFGAFVKMPGEIGQLEDSAAFSSQPIWQRVIIVVAGVVSFWIMAAIIFTALFGAGAPVSISDSDNSLSNPKVQITEVANNSPAKDAGLQIGDNILAIKSPTSKTVNVNKISEVQDFINSNKGQELALTIGRGKQTFNKTLLARANPPQGQGSLGVGLDRIAIEHFPWWKAPWEGIKFTGTLTKAIILGYANVISNIFNKQPTGVELTGPVGIVKMGMNILQLGWNYFLLFLGQIAVYIAIFNILPIPALDGGKLVFLGIEGARKRPVNPRVEERITAAFFGVLILLMIFVTIQDIIR